MKVAMAANRSPSATSDGFEIHLSDFAKFNRRETTHRVPACRRKAFIHGNAAVEPAGRAGRAIQAGSMPLHAVHWQPANFHAFVSAVELIAMSQWTK
jgi:hypothetical protein